jgi:serine protease AprX
VARVRLALALVCILGAASPGLAGPRPHPKLDNTLNVRARESHGFSRVIVTLRPGRDISPDVQKLGGKLGRRLHLIDSQVVVLPNGKLRHLADLPAVVSMHWDRPTAGENSYTAVTTGVRAAQLLMGYTGAGVGVAVVDSGITGWHDDLTYSGYDRRVMVSGGQRVAGFVDYVNGRTSPYDDHGHGTHVAGIIAGNGYDSWGARAGMAPAAHLVSLKVLDANGRGVISNVIAALGYAVQYKSAYNLRVINLSVGAAVTESYRTDPLTLAAKRAVEAGLVVVTAAGNLGKNAAGEVQYGGITAPGNAPWVLTVGASNHMGTIVRYDDTIASYSSRGPSAIDFMSKPDVVAPGTGIVSLASPNSTLYNNLGAYLLVGSSAKPYKPYLSLSGTSMAAPVVSGTIALMLQANPGLTPNLVKGLLQYTAQSYNYNTFTQGAGFLNAYDAVRLAKFLAHPSAGDRYPTGTGWSRQIIWGNHLVTGGVIKPAGSAWATNVTWGSAVDAEGQNIVWGTLCSRDCENIVWGTARMDDENIAWGTFNSAENIVWGTTQCNPLIDPNCENIVWGTVTNENVVWGTLCGRADCENIVWGTSTATCNPLIDPACENIVWGTGVCNPTLDPLCENIVWGTNAVCDVIADPTCQNIVWGTDNGAEVPLFEDPNSAPVSFDQTDFDSLFAPPASDGAVSESTAESTSGPIATDASIGVGITGGL